MLNPKKHPPSSSNAQNSAPADPFGGGSFDFGIILNFLYVIKERWFIGLLAGLTLATFYAHRSLQEIPLYHASVHILFEPRADRVIDIQQVVETTAGGQADNLLDFQMRIIRSRAFRENVAASFNDAEIAKIVEPYRNPEGGTPSLQGVLGGSVFFHRDGSAGIVVNAHHRDPQAAALIVNRFAERYIASVVTRTGVGNAAAIQFLQEQAADLRTRIEESDRALVDYRRRYNLVSLEDNQNLIVSRLQALNGALTNARIRLLALEADVAMVEAANEGQESLLEVPSLARFGSVPGLHERLEEARAERRRLDLRYLSRHPLMVQNANLLAVYDERLEAELKRGVRDLFQRRAHLLEEIEKLTNQLAQAENEALLLDSMAIDYNVLRRKLESDRRTFDDVIARLNETNVASQLDNTNVRVLDQAEPPWGPFTPDRNKIFAVTAILFLMGMVGVPIAVEFLDTRLKSAADVEQTIGKPLLADIQAVKGKKQALKGRLVVDEEDEAITEVYRSVYASLKIHGVEQIPKAIMVTSALPKEGKSFFVSNFAAACALHGHRVLIIDADLRRPSQAANFGVSGKVGTLSWIENGAHLPQDENAPLPENLGILEISPMLHLLPSGGSSKKSTEVLEHPRFAALIQAARRKYEFILIDTPPVSLFPDALFAARLAEESIFICKHNAVSRTRVKQCITTIENTHTPVSGVVINNRTSSKGLRPGYGSSPYGYTYRYGPKEYKAHAKYYQESAKSS